MKRHKVLILVMLGLVGGGTLAYYLLVSTKPPTPSTQLDVSQAATIPKEGVSSDISSSPADAASGSVSNSIPPRRAEPSKPYITSAVSGKAGARSSNRLNSDTEARLLARYDANGDGKLDENEKGAMRRHLQKEFEPLRNRMLAAYDSNGDGKLDADEQQAGRKAELAKLDGLRTSMLPKYDANLNGTIDPGERAEIRRDGQEFLKDVKAQVTQRYDANNNGVLDPEESAAVSAVAEKLRQEMRERLKQYDVNGDGKLDEAERDKLKSDLESKSKQGK